MAGTGAGVFGARQRVTGPGASSLKYDILTALLVTAAQGSPVEARLALRLSLVITARFNWRQGIFAIGQRELARMWGVTERTAKREMAAMRSLCWISVAVPAARGRVTQYRIEFDAVLRQTMPHWDAVGPDFATRMAGAPEPSTPSADNVVPLRPSASVQISGDSGPWAAAAMRLEAEDPAVFKAWFAALVPVDAAAGQLTLLAPSRFVAEYLRAHYQTRLHAAVAAVDRSVREVRFTWTGA